MNETLQQPEPANRGGLAPEDRQCRYVLGHGRHCRSWALRGHEFCHKHLRWDETRHDGPITVLLVEDASAIQLVASQTIRALAWGHMPPENGRGILYGCRLMQIAQAHQLAEAKFRLKCHQLGLDPNLFLPTGDPASAAPTQSAPEAQQSRDTVILSEARSAESKDLHLSLDDTAPASVQSDASGCPMSPVVADLDERGSAPTAEPRVPDVWPPLADLGQRDSAPAPELAHLSAAADVPAPYRLSPTPSSHPLDDLPPAPIPKSVCEPCVAALAQGADESLLGCKVCPASKAGNLRAPRLPDPRNPPETPHEPTPIPPIGQAAFRDLKTKWEDALDRLGHTRADVRFPRYCEPREDFRAARRQRPFADFLHHYATAPPPPIPPQPAAPPLATPAPEPHKQC
ncbi:MAG TPA: hypothetical protein VJV22_17485 [Acidobacteriaceae bacterium]|nr:hypothetical protein [Acidobacteriaceae bacterium]